MGVTRQFLGWDQPLPEAAAAFLLARAGEGRILDLSRLLAVVPTRNSGRRLREMLANLAHEQGRALLPPRVVPPEFLLTLLLPPSGSAPRVAGAMESLLAWIKTLIALDLGRYRSFFPVDPVEQDFPWALAVAADLVELRRLLGESGLQLADVEKQLPLDFEEKQRWRDLRRLEERYRETLLAGTGKDDLEAVRALRLSRPVTAPPGIEEVILLAAPDPVPIALPLLEKLGEALPVAVAIYAPEGAAELFDPWGRPNVLQWIARPLPIPDFESRVHLAANPEAQASAAAEIAVAAGPDLSRTVAFGILDSEITPILERRLAGEQVRAFNPQGTPLEREGIYFFLRTLCHLLRGREFGCFLNLLRCPEVTAAVLSRSRGSWSAMEMLEGFDRLIQDRFPDTMEKATAILEKATGNLAEPDEHWDPRLASALREVTKMLDDLAGSSPAESLRTLLESLFGTVPQDSGAGKVLVAASPAMLACLEELKSCDLPAADQLEVLLFSLRRETLFEERPAEAVELQGWLELLWEDAPHLVIAGFNDGLAPESIRGDAYLPESLRKALVESGFDLTTNERRVARDSYLVESMLAWRRERGGRVDFFLGKLSNAGDPLRPSRLLLRCADDELPRRCVHVFREAPPSSARLAWSPGFRLEPRPSRELKSMRVTGFAAYLRSPFHFFLTHVEQMRAIDPDKVELDALDFGNICHRILQEFGKGDIRNSRDAEEIRRFFDDAIHQECGRFGNPLTLPLEIQFEAMRRRLGKAAEVQAWVRAQGWRIHAVEQKLEAFVIDGVEIRGTIDRIDQHDETGEIRILDYKTGDKPDDPEKKHLSRVTASSRVQDSPPYARFDLAGKEMRWDDLQLPLYRLALQRQFTEDIRCGYFNLPKALGDAGVIEWKDNPCQLDQEALICAEGVIRDVRRGQFDRIGRPARSDEFVDLHLNDPGKTIDFRHLSGS